VIANFTAGEDLTLVEVCDALDYLQKQANTQTEIVMGTTQNPSMDDRVQAILVITGLGAISLEDLLPGVERVNVQSESKNDLESISNEAAPNPNTRELTAAAAPMAANNLDLPAFLRRKSQVTG
jgi:cell division GTPase FtsZ